MKGGEKERRRLGEKVYSHASFSFLPVFILAIPEVLDGSKPTGDTSKLVQVIHNSLTHVQVIGVPCILGGWREGRGGGDTHS